jgi:hypothetical protein
MWIIQEPKKVALWIKRHFEEKNGECAACLKYSVCIFVEKKIYIKCNIWRVAVRPSWIWDARFLKVNSAGASVDYWQARCARQRYNAGYTMFQCSVKGTGYPLHSPVSPSLPHPCVTVCHHISTGVYNKDKIYKQVQPADPVLKVSFKLPACRYRKSQCFCNTAVISLWNWRKCLVTQNFHKERDRKPSYLAVVSLVFVFIVKVEWSFG